MVSLFWVLTGKPQLPFSFVTILTLVRQSGSAFCTTAGENFSAVAGRHSLHEAVNSFSLQLFGLIRSFHNTNSPFAYPSPKKRKRAEITNLSQRSGQSAHYDVSLSISETLQVNIINGKQRFCQANPLFFSWEPHFLFTTTIPCAVLSGYCHM